MPDTIRKYADKDKQETHDQEVSRLSKLLDETKQRLYEGNGSNWEGVFSHPDYTQAYLAFRTQYNRCPQCQSDNTAVENVDQVWRDGDIICQDCRTYVRYWDPS